VPVLDVDWTGTDGTEERTGTGVVVLIPDDPPICAGAGEDREGVDAGAGEDVRTGAVVLVPDDPPICATAGFEVLPSFLGVAMSIALLCRLGVP